MSALSLTAGHEPALSVEQIESHLIEAANRHHLEERNIAYWLLEIDRRGLYRTRTFSSLGDYARELVGIKPRKAWYLVFIAERLENLPNIRAAFDAGKLSWTKAREIVAVARTQKRSGSRKLACCRIVTSRGKCGVMMDADPAGSPRSRSRCRLRFWRCGTTPMRSRNV